MKAENLLTIKKIKQQIVRIRNEGRIKTISKRCDRLLKMYYHIIIKY